MRHPSAKASGGGAGLREGSTSFSVEKEAKRLLLIWAGGVRKSRLQRNKIFCAAFFKKAAAFLGLFALGLRNDGYPETLP
jgi:hypothetical protein